ncbi:MAG: LptF/LptG family permease [Candidatus Pacebacteria bacterium]|nr:LptF/LptG family permease [Candidatus Paceibacterota bacterium]
MSAPFSVPSRRLSWTLFGYISRQYLVPLACCIVGFFMLFLVMDIFDDLPDFLDAKSPLAGTLVYFLARQPLNIINVLPMSILLAVTFTINILGRHWEITALRASGISVVQSCLPIWVTSIVVAGAVFWINEDVGPDALARSESLRARLLGEQEAYETEPERLAFRNGKANRNWFFESFSRAGAQRGVSVKQFAPGGKRMKWELRADRAVYAGGRWHFYTVTIWEYAKGDSLPVSREELQHYVNEELTEDPREIFNSLRPVEELSTVEMMGILRTNPGLPDSTKAVFETMIWYRLAFPLSCIVATLFGVGLAVGRHGASALRGVAFAVGIMVLYYVVTQACVVLGKYGFLPPVIAGAVPPLCFIAWGIREVYKGR